MAEIFSSEGCADAMVASAVHDEADNAIDNAVVEQLQRQVYDLKSSLGLMCAFLESDIEAGIVTATPTRTRLLAAARHLATY